MSEATELEQAIRETAAQPFDLAAVVASCCAAYRDVYPEREIAYRCDAAGRDDASAPASSWPSCSTSSSTTP